jgi:hypothetical protein
MINDCPLDASPNPGAVAVLKISKISLTFSEKGIINYTIGEIQNTPPERSKNMKRPVSVPSAPFVAVILFVCALVFVFPTPSHAGHALIPMTDEYVYLAQSREEIIAAWGGNKEVLILASELAASRKTAVLRFIALPARPTVETSSKEALSRLDALLTGKAPQIGVIVDGRKTNKHAEIGIELISESTVSPRDITVVRIETFEGFERWVTDLMKREGVENPAPRIEQYRAVVTDYLSRNIKYFVFDVVTVGEKKAAVDPLVLRFRADCLFVPFLVSSRTSGMSAVDLYLVAPGSPKAGAVPYCFSPLSYKIPDGIDFSKYPHLLKQYNPLTYPKDHPVSFPVTMPDRVALSPAVAQVIPGWATKARFAAFRYRGDLSGLSADITLTRDDFEDADFETAAEAGKAAGEFGATAPDEKFNILTAIGAGRFPTDGSDPYTAGAAIDGDPSTPYILPRNGEWIIDCSKERKIDGIEIVAAVTKPDIVPSKNRLCLYASDTGEFSGEEKRIDTCVVRSYTSTTGADDPTRYAEKVVLTDRRFSARFLKITYPYSESICNIYLFEVMPWGRKKD